MFAPAREETVAMYMRVARARVAECLQCGRPGGRGGTEGCGSGWFHGRRKDVAPDVGRVGFPGAPLEQNAGVEKSPRHPSCRVRGSRCLCCAFPAGEGRCPWSRIQSSATSVGARTCAEKIGFSRRPNPLPPKQRPNSRLGARTCVESIGFSR